MKITLLGNKSDVYIDSVNNNAIMDYKKAVNFNNVDMNGVNNLIIRQYDDGNFKIVQAGGYSYDRGMFVDLY
jgi:hypothetical protein